MTPHDGTFSGDAENVIRWVNVAGVILAAVGMAMLFFVLWQKPGWRATPVVKVMLFTAIFLLPATTMLLGSVVGFHKVKQSCAECHAMDPWVNDMKNPDSPTLAAKHYRNRWINEDQCYTCHSGYGLSGNIEAKKGGVGHVLHQYFLGVPKEIKIRKPFPTSTCLHCHANAESFRKVEPHMDPEMKPQILSGKMSCFECHEAPHPRKK